jgi:hypothetical protein
MALSYMEHRRNFYYNLKRYGLRLSSKEIRGMIISVLILAFVFSFREWGDKTFDFTAGIINYLIAIVLVGIAFFFNQLGQRLIAIYYGYDPEYEVSSIGLMLSLVIAFASRGYLIVFLPGYTIINMLAASRLGEFRYYTNLWEWAKSLFGAPLFSFIVCCITALLPLSNPIIKKFLFVNILFAAWSLLPLPGNPGMYMFWYHKYFWGFAVGFVGGGLLLLWLTNPWIALFGSCLTGLVAIIYYFIIVDKNI